eukprot:jgi/Antlo1/2346/2322
MQSSGCLSDVVRCCREAKGRVQSMCMKLIALAAEHFPLTKRCFEEVFCAVEHLHNIPGTAHVAECLAAQDKFFFFYLAVCRENAQLSVHAKHALLHLDSDTLTISAAVPISARIELQPRDNLDVFPVRKL